MDNVIALKDEDQFSEDLGDMLELWRRLEQGDPNFIRTLGHSEQLLRAFVPFYSPVIRKGLVEHRTKELVRIKVAYANQCHYCMNTRYGSGRRAGIDEDLVAEVFDYETSDAFTDRERAALRFTDEIYFDPWRVPPDAIDQALGQFTREELQELVWAICLWVETGRMFHALEVPYEGADDGLEPQARRMAQLT